MGSRKPRGASVEVAGGMINTAHNVFFYFRIFLHFFAPLIWSRARKRSCFSYHVVSSSRENSNCLRRTKINSHSTPRLILFPGSVSTLCGRHSRLRQYLNRFRRAPRLENIKKKKTEKQKTPCSTYIQEHRVIHRACSPTFFFNPIFEIFKHYVMYTEEHNISKVFWVCVLLLSRHEKSREFEIITIWSSSIYAINQIFDYSVIDEENENDRVRRITPVCSVQMYLYIL